jgi:hypothetical protein
VQGPLPPRERSQHRGALRLHSRHPLLGLPLSQISPFFCIPDKSRKDPHTMTASRVEVFTASSIVARAASAATAVYKGLPRLSHLHL